MARTPKDEAWTYDLFSDLAADPATCLISYCCPCVTYGQTAENVHGPAGSCVSHGAKFCLYSCLCACGMVAGPTRRAIRSAYKLPAQPQGIGSDVQTDCLLYTIPCLNCLALCQDANEIRARAPSAPLDARPFDWAPVPGWPLSSDAATTTTTAAPAVAEMSKDAAPAAPAATQ